MLIRLISDLHLDAFYGQDHEHLVAEFVPPDPRDAEACLVISGDISSALDQLIGFLNTVAPRFHKVLFVPGNHELYRHELNEWYKSFSNAELKENIIFCTNFVLQYQLQGVRFIMCTLWGDGGSTRTEQGNVDAGLSDFYVIRNGDDRFTVHDMMTLHKIQKAALIRQLLVPFDGKTVVCTHHLPSYKLCHPRFGTSINGGFASNCDDILAADYAPDLWVHGHTHDRISTIIGRTKIECNPAGYRREWNTKFNTYRSGPVFIEI